MKKIIIVNNNMKVGGVQKSLYNLLWETEGKYEVTLLLFCKLGEYTDKLPPGVRILECSGLFRYLGISQGECKRLPDKLIRGTLAALSRIFGRAAVLRLLCLAQRKLPETYDCAISFLHNGRPEAFYGGAQDFVLNCVRAKKKIVFLHGDYRSCGANHPRNNQMMARFDVIAACSDGCRRAFCQALPELSKRCVTVRNFHRLEEILSLARQEPICYEEGFVHVVMVSRLTHEKAIHRAVIAAAKAVGQGLPVLLHLVGGGPEESALRTMAEELGIRDRVIFYGQQSNPYRFLKNADLFLLTSYHEAAPMVIEEARCLGVPVLTTRTTSSQEMVTQENCGWVCENDQEALEEIFLDLLRNPQKLREMKESLRRSPMDNGTALRQFTALIEDRL